MILGIMAICTCLVVVAGLALFFDSLSEPEEPRIRVIKT